MKKIAIYGFGGFGKEVACLLNHLNKRKPQWDLIGFFDDGVVKGKVNQFGQVIGDIHTLNSWNEPLSVVIAVANPFSLKKIADSINNEMVFFPNIIAPNVIFYDKSSTNMGKGNLIYFGCRLSCDVVLGDFNLFNGAVAIGHDVNVGSFNVLGPSVRVSGDCKIGSSNFFGIQSILLQGLTVGNNTRIGANSVIIRNTKDDNLYMGNPAKIVKI